MEGGRRGDHLDERPVPLHRQGPVLPRLQARPQQGARRHTSRRRRLRRQGGHPSRAAPRLPVPQGRRKAGEAPGLAGGGVQPPALPQRPHLPDQDRRALRRPDHRPGAAPCTGTPAPTPTTPSTSPAPRPTRPAGPYDIPNAWVDAYTIYTNKPWGTAYRGFGHVEFFWGLERHMELVAEVIGMDPLEFRKKNLLKPGLDHAHRRDGSTSTRAIPSSASRLPPRRSTTAGSPPRSKSARRARAGGSARASRRSTRPRPCRASPRPRRSSR